MSNHIAAADYYLDFGTDNLTYTMQSKQLFLRNEILKGGVGGYLQRTVTGIGGTKLRENNIYLNRNLNSFVLKETSQGQNKHTRQ